MDVTLFDVSQNSAGISPDQAGAALVKDRPYSVFKLRECRQQHAADFFGHLLGLQQQTSQTDKCLVIGSCAHRVSAPVL
jgi:hypothetical protein